ncbi:MAG: 1,4-beta-xylanase, partial [Acidobacteriaceae bacterium]|nr:1,4-beta-xylanase [Acidobacteriaceae bacterium]
MRIITAIVAGTASLALALLLLAQNSPGSQARWSVDAANRWYGGEPWLVGSNYLPSNASNELEMWQQATFDPKRIDTELGWAQDLGMNTMRVFLHDLPWKEDSKGFVYRVKTFLAICEKHKIKPLLVIFDSCWDPNPHLGPQSPPRAGIHNSRWVQSPGLKALEEPSQYPRLETYVKGIVGAFAHDDRVLGWD